MSVADISANDWVKEVINAETLVVVDFWHERCVWCKRLEPIYKEVAKEFIKEFASLIFALRLASGIFLFKSINSTLFLIESINSVGIFLSK